MSIHLRLCLEAWELYSYNLLAQSAGAVGYTNCISAEGKDPLNECLGYHKIHKRKCSSEIQSDNYFKW